MADQKKPPHEDLLLDVILAEARTLKESGRPPREAPAPAEEPPREEPEAFAAAEEQPVRAETGAGVSGEPSPRKKPEKKKRRGLFGRRKREYPELSEEDDIYYGLQLKTLDEYRKDYEKTILIDSKKVREAAQNSSYSYLFSQSDDDAVDLEITQKFEELHEKRKQRVEQALHGAGIEQDDIFSLYEPPREEPKAKTPLPQEEPAVPPAQPPVVPPEKPSPVPTPAPSPVPQPAPAPKPDILPGPERQPEIPQPLSNPVYRPEPLQPSAPQPVGAPMILEQTEEANTPAAQPAGEEAAPPLRTEPPEPEAIQIAAETEAAPAEALSAGPEPETPAAPVKEPVSIPSVTEEVPPPQPRREPENPVPFRVRESRAYRAASGRPVHTIELNDFDAVFTEAAAEYPQPEPAAPVPLPKRRAQTEFKSPIVLEHTSEFEAVSENSSAAAQAEEPAPPISFPVPAVPPEEADEASAAAEKTGKKRKFNIFGSEEEENDDQEELSGEPEELEDYGSPADAPSILNDLAADVRKLFLRLSVTGIAAVLLLAIGLFGEYSGLLPAAVRVTLDTQTYLILNLVFLLIAAAFSITPLLDGIRALFRFQANSDTALSAAVLAAVIQSCAAFAAQSAVQNGSIHVYVVLACIALFLNTLGKLTMARRIYSNFRYIASPEQKLAVQLFDDHNTALQMAKDCVLDTPAIAYQSKADFFGQFLHDSYDPDPSDRSARIMGPVGFACALILCLVTLILTKNAEQAIAAFAAAACVSVPFAGTLSVGLPLRRLSKIASRCGAMIVGYPAVEQFSEVNAVMVDAKDLFPRGTVILNEIKTFAGQRIDQAILDATALMCAVGGPLSDLFDQIIKSRHDMLPKIDQPIYEDDKGVTGWVNGRRILVGSRALMESHSIEPPSRDYEAKYVQGGKRVVYLASGGDLVAMFILSYTSDRRRSLELRRMEDNGISLIVRTCDPNITPVLLAECFGLEEQSIRVLPNDLGAVYADLTAAPRKEVPALLATKGSPAAMMRMLTACARQRGNISIAVALQNVSMILGLLLVGFLTVYSGFRQLGTTALLLYELFWVAAVVTVPRLRKP